MQKNPASPQLGPQLFLQIQNPPVKKVGVLDLDSFYPAKDRVELSLAINNLLAAPSFTSWRPPNS